MSTTPFRMEDSGRSIHSNWMLSFGDLLTLLLCFFLSILSFSSLNPANKAANKADKVQEVIASDASASPSELPVTSDGTQLAELEASDRKAALSSNHSLTDGLRLWFVEGDYDATGWELNEPAAVRLKNQVVRTAYAPKRVTIESCLPSTRFGDETAWAGAISRILSLRSQLIDAGFKSGVFQYRVLGPHCSEVRTAGQDEPIEAQSAVSRVTVEFETTNG